MLRKIYKQYRFRMVASGFVQSFYLHFNFSVILIKKRFFFLVNFQIELGNNDLILCFDSGAQLLWNKLRIAVVGAALFRKAGAQRASRAAGAAVSAGSKYSSPPFIPHRS